MKLILATVAALASLAPLAAKAQQPPQQIPLPADVAQHVVEYLTNGGTYAEAHGLAQQIVAAARAAMAEAAKPAAPLPAPPPKVDKP